MLHEISSFPVRGSRSSTAWVPAQRGRSQSKTKKREILRYYAASHAPLGDAAGVSVAYGWQVGLN